MNLGPSDQDFSGGKMVFITNNPAEKSQVIFKFIDTLQHLPILSLRIVSTRSTKVHCEGNLSGDYTFTITIRKDLET